MLHLHQFCIYSWYSQYTSALKFQIKFWETVHLSPLPSPSPITVQLLRYWHWSNLFDKIYIFFVGVLVQYFRVCGLNPFTPKILFLILLSVCHNLLIDVILYSHHLFAWYFIDNVRRSSAFVTHWSSRFSRIWFRTSLKKLSQFYLPVSLASLPKTWTF